MPRGVESQSHADEHGARIAAVVGADPDELVFVEHFFPVGGYVAARAGADPDDQAVWRVGLVPGGDVEVESFAAQIVGNVDLLLDGIEGPANAPGD